MKFLMGLAVALVAGWLWHAPLGKGEQLIAGLEVQAAQAVAATALPGISVTLDRNPPSRRAILSGPANDFQREGLGGQPGLTALVSGIDGISTVAWADEPAARDRAVPLLLETLLLATLAYLLGLALAWLLWGRKRRKDFA